MLNFINNEEYTKEKKLVYKKITQLRLKVL